MGYLCLNVHVISLFRQQESEETERKEGKKVERNESFSWAAVQRRPVIQQSVTEEVLAMPEKKGDVVNEVVSVEQKNRNADLDEQLKLLEKDSSNHVDINHNSGHEQEVTVQTVERVESSHHDLDKMFNEMSNDHGSSNGTEKVYNKKLPVGRVLSNEEEKELIESGALKRVERECHPRVEPTQEDLLPMYMEEKRRIDEERKKKRELEEEKIRQAREDRKRQDEENRQQFSSRKAAIQEAKGKLEKQISQTEHIVPTTDAGRLIEKELAEQRIRDEEARIRIEQLNRESKEHRPEDKGISKAQPKEIVIDSSPAESRHQFNVPVLRRQKHEDSSNTRNNRKSWVELEIEQQKLKDEEMRREREERQKDFNRLPQSNKQVHAVKRDIDIVEESVVKSSFKGSVESQPVKQTSQMFSKPPARNSGSVPPPRGATKPNTTVPEHATSVHQNVHSKGGARSKTTVYDSMDGVDGSMTKNEAELERRIQEEEEKRRLKQIEKVRQDSLKREAEELVRQRDIREEEIRKRKEQHLKEAEKIKKEEQERREEQQRQSEQRRLKFEVEKIRLEERVIRTMKESQESQTTSRVRTASSSSEHSTHEVPPPPPADEDEVRERRRSVRDAKALFERPQEQPKVVMRQKRQSLNLDNTATAVKPNRNPNRASFYSDAIVSQELKTTKAIEIIRLDDPDPKEKQPPSRLVLGDISSKRQQYETRQGSQPVSGRSDKNGSLFTSSISSNQIQQEMAELARKEEEIRLRREQLMRASSTEQDSLDGIKRNPLPSKMQVC